LIWHKKTTEVADRIKEEVTKAGSTVTAIGVIAVLALVVAVAALVVGVRSASA